MCCKCDLAPLGWVHYMLDPIPCHIKEIVFFCPMPIRQARFEIGQIVRHKYYPFRGVVYDVDPVFDNTEEWWNNIPEEIRPSKDQPFYHLFAENAEGPYMAYVSEQNLLPDTSGEPVDHPDIEDYFLGMENGHYIPAQTLRDYN